MNILLIGSGGREHAFATKMVSSPKCGKLYIAPGNAGTSEIAENIALSVTDFKGVKELILSKKIGMVVVGPEEPLVKGISDFLSKDEDTKQVLVIGPTQKGATLEGSKDFSKQFMVRNGIPTSAYRSFTTETLLEGLEFIHHQNLPIVLKADGLAAGKGVLIIPSYDEAEKSFKEMLLENKFGDASKKVVVEEFLSGIELSVFVATDGRNYRILPEAKDYKRIGENDTGLNTGGMGAISPVPFADDVFMKKVEEKVVRPTIEGLTKESIDYKGFLFIGLMNVGGEPQVIEYNVRMGDPETQAVLPRIKSDFMDLLYAIGTKSLSGYSLEIEDCVTATVVMVAGGYPGSYVKGDKIDGLKNPDDEKAITFHAGTTRDDGSGSVLTNGGRVLGITGKGNTVEEAIAHAYERAKQISWDNHYYRKDIGQDIIHYGK
ncbi:MAG: phosphoribosylamine--glycine ligase [Anditalea sp.]